MVWTFTSLFWDASRSDQGTPSFAVGCCGKSRLAWPISQILDLQRFSHAWGRSWTWTELSRCFLFWLHLYSRGKSVLSSSRIPVEALLQRLACRFFSSCAYLYLLRSSSTKLLATWRTAQESSGSPCWQPKLWTCLSRASGPPWRCSGWPWSVEWSALAWRCTLGQCN